MNPELARDWLTQLRMAGEALRVASDDPEVTIELCGTLRGPAGQGRPLLLEATRMAAEQGLHIQASVRSRTVSVRLRRAHHPLTRRPEPETVQVGRPVHVTRRAR
jgi:hypothetical protein